MTDAEKTPDQLALEELNRALSRWERLASMPKWTEFPIVVNLAAACAAERRLREAGNVARADELVGDIAAEAHRLELRRTWTGRSAIAWEALAIRLLAAIGDVAQRHAASADELNLAAARYRDARARVVELDLVAHLARSLN